MKRMGRKIVMAVLTVLIAIGPILAFAGCAEKKEPAKTPTTPEPNKVPAKPA